MQRPDSLAETLTFEDVKPWDDYFQRFLTWRNKYEGVWMKINQPHCVCVTLVPVRFLGRFVEIRVVFSFTSFSWDWIYSFFCFSVFWIPNFADQIHQDPVTFALSVGPFSSLKSSSVITEVTRKRIWWIKKTILKE